MAVTFVAEVSSNHHQDMSRCVAFIEKAADIGCQIAGFQTKLVLSFVISNKGSARMDTDSRSRRPVKEKNETGGPIYTMA